VGTRIVKQVDNCTKDFESDLWLMFCHVKTESDASTNATTSDSSSVPQVAATTMASIIKNITEKVRISAKLSTF
jgi:hypothetical protein